MPSRRLPRTNQARQSALRSCKERNDFTPPADSPLSATTTSNLNTGYPIYLNRLNTASNAKSNQTQQSALVVQLRDSARLWVSHGFQALINACLRGSFPNGVKNQYGLALDARAIPDMGTEQAILDAALAYETGESARTLAGGAPITFPSQMDITGAVNAFRNANLQQSVLKTAYDTAQEAVNELNPDADKVILRMWNEIETAFDTGDKPSMRRKAREWGVVYIPTSGETPTADDYSIIGAATDSLTNLPLANVVVELIGTGVSYTTDADGKFYLPPITPGSYTLSASVVGYLPFMQPVTIVAGQVLQVGVVLMPTAPIPMP